MPLGRDKGGLGHVKGTDILEKGKQGLKMFNSTTIVLAEVMTSDSMTLCL